MGVPHVCTVRTRCAFVQHNALFVDSTGFFCTLFVTRHPVCVTHAHGSFFFFLFSSMTPAFPQYVTMVTKF
jgi:hypothetical protein